MHSSYTSIIFLIFGALLISLAAIIGSPLIYLGTSAIYCLVAGAVGLRDIAKLHASQSLPSRLSAATAQHIGMLWAWGAISLFITYSFFLPPWREWGVFSGSFAILAAVSLIFSAVMKIDSQKGKQDHSLLKLGRVLTMIQLVGTIAAMIGLLIDPQKSFLSIEKRDWAANNIFFFGALGLALMSAAALFYSRKETDETLV